MPPNPKTSRRLPLLLAATLLLAALAAGGAWLYLNSLLDQLDYSARVTQAQPSAECAALARDMGSLLGRFADLAGDLPFKVQLPGQPPPTPQPDDDPDDGRFEGDTCTVEVHLEITLHNPMPFPAELEILQVEGTLAGEPVDGDLVRFNTAPHPLPPRQDTAEPVQLRFQLAHLVAAGGGLLLRKSIPVQARALVRVRALGGLLQRTLKIQLERRLTLQELVHGFQGTVNPEQEPE